MAKSKKKQSNSAERAEREAQKKARREERKRREEAERRRRLLRRRARTWGVVALAVIVGGTAVFFIARPDPELDGVERPSFQGRNHVAAGSPIDYGTAAPTSGPHFGSVANCGAYTERPDLPLVVHALEHGAVVFWYRPDVEEDVRPRLLEVMRAYDSHVIVAPNPGIEEPVVATAWNRRMSFTDVDDPLIEEFAETYRQRGPERVACPN